MKQPAFIRSPMRFARDLLCDRRGNVLMIMGFAAIPLIFAGGMAVDYSNAARLQTKLNAAADAAALAAVTQPMMLQSNDAAKTAATNMFKSQLPNLNGLVWNDANLHVEVTGNDTATTTRTAVVTYAAASTNFFAGILGMQTVAIGGSSTSTATAAPNIDFYLALDTSSSMALPTTSAGFTVMDNALHCSFACHSNKIQNYVGSGVGKLPSLILDNTTFSIVKSTNVSGTVNGYAITKIDANGTYIYNNKTNNVSSSCKISSKDKCVYNSDGTYADSYWYALNKGVRLRVTDEKEAAQNLMTLAKQYAAENNRTYRAALYTFDHSTNLQTIATLSSDLDSVGTRANSIDLVRVNDQAGNGCPPTGCTGSNTYLFTSYKSIMDKMLNDLPVKSGKGTNDPGDTPQAFLFIVTDGMSDEMNFSTNQRTRSAMLQAQIDQCTTIKNRGIKIAILYTEYTAASVADDEPNQKAIAEAAIPNIAPALTNCASSGLMFTVKTDQSINDALQALFAKAVSTARLAQ